MPRHKIDEKPEGTILCLLKSGSGVTQIQRRHNRDNFDVTRMTITNVINKHGKEQKLRFETRKHMWFIGDIRRLFPMWSRRSGL